MTAVPALTEAALLDAWEQALGLGRVHRAVVLAAASGADGVWDLPLGRRDATLLELHRACFGEQLAGIADCPACGEALEVGMTVEELLVPDPLAGSVAGGAVRPLSSRDVACVDPAAPDARAQLVARCLDDDPPRACGDLADAAARLAASDPQAAVAVPLLCPECGNGWTAPIDVAGHVWDEIDRWARRLLDDVHALAHAYGWREADVLAVSPVRRRIYLDAVS